MYKPLLEKHLTVSRTYSYKGLVLQIPPGVFHPKYFFSTKLLLHYMLHFSLHGKTVLELGAGSGLLSLMAARCGARVTATDINPVAVECLKKNAAINRQEIRIVLSDMFESLSREAFDIVAVNPPYYQKNPGNYAEYAWYCGEKGEYFQALFSGLKDYLHTGSTAVMVLCDACNFGLIHQLADQYEWRLNCVLRKSNLLENNFIITIEPGRPVHKKLPLSSAPVFESIYIRLREAEHRLYSDEEVQNLPDISSLHPHYKEWIIRKKSTEKLIRYLSRKEIPLNILEIGCGNGWLSHQLSVIPESHVTGIETNITELRQALRIFSQRPNLNYVQGNFNKIDLHGDLFDIVVMAASIQYFSSVQSILNHILQYYLKPGSEIHIIDSPFYQADEVAAARERTVKYYTQLGFPEMIPFYFHHSFSELVSFKCHFMKNIIIRQSPLIKNMHSFYWIRVKNK